MSKTAAATPAKGSTAKFKREIEEKPAVPTTGKSRFTFDDGTVYEGEWQLITVLNPANPVDTISKRVRHGAGHWTGVDQSQYRGQWCEDRMEGEGAITYPDGSSYTGTFKSSVYHGQGKFEWNDGSMYEGEWLDGQMHGAGELRLSDGQVFAGKFHCDQFRNDSGHWTAPHVPLTFE